MKRAIILSLTLISSAFSQLTDIPLNTGFLISNDIHRNLPSLNLPDSVYANLEESIGNSKVQSIVSNSSEILGENTKNSVGVKVGDIALSVSWTTVIGIQGYIWIDYTVHIPGFSPREGQIKTRLRSGWITGQEQPGVISNILTFSDKRVFRSITVKIPFETGGMKYINGVWSYVVNVTMRTVTIEVPVPVSSQRFDR